MATRCLVNLALLAVAIRPVSCERLARQLSLEVQQKASDESSANETQSLDSGRGMNLDMGKCGTERKTRNTPVGYARILCEDLKEVFLKLTPSVNAVSGKATAWHCGLEAVSENGMVVRRYDLGSAGNWLNLLEIKIECSEGDEMHGLDMKQIPYPSSSYGRVQPTGYGPGEFTFGLLEDYIRNNQIVANRYDAHGGNCQHFSIAFYEYLTGSPRCGSGIQPPNSDIITGILASICSMQLTALTYIIPGLSFVSAVVDIRAAVYKHVKPILDSNSQAFQGSAQRC